MRVHSVEKIKELKKLRRRGYSINELVAKLFIPKTTVWYHIHNVKVSHQYIPALMAKRGGSAKRAQKNWENAQRQAKELLQSSLRDYLITIAMLYWGEGNKKVCEFINSDGKMIQIYLGIMRKVFNVPEEAIKATVRIFSGMNRTLCLNYWSDIANIPKHRFIVRLNDGGTRGKTKYGMCRITIRKGANVLKLLHSLKNQIFDGMIKDM